MKKMIMIVLASAGALCFLMPALGEYVFLRDGRIIQGTIVRENALSVTVQDREKKTETYTRGNIMRILYTELYMGRIHVQMNDGRGLTGFMVDEDRTTYTFRKELNDPNEFTVKREDVLFIARRNPSGLKGEASTDRIEMKWSPPYNQVKGYRIYVKGPGEFSFRKAAETSRQRFELEELKSNSNYTMFVTAVANDGDESMPSNEIALTTKNIRPRSPRILPVTRTRAPGGGAESVRIQWAPATDPDGKVEKYRVYAMDKGGKKLLADTRTESHTFNTAATYDRVYVSSVDDMGDESETVRVFGLQGREMNAILYPGVVLPLGAFGKITGPGYGAVAAFTISGWFYENLVLGAETGYYAFQGKDALDSEYKKTTTVYMVPMLLTAGYSFELAGDFSVVPYMSMGVVYFYADYVSRDRVTFNDRNENISEAGPAAGAGIAGIYRLTHSISATARLSFGWFVGADSGLYGGLDIGCLYRL
jgi:hypothetical protein